MEHSEPFCFSVVITGPSRTKQKYPYWCDYLATRHLPAAYSVPSQWCLDNVGEQYRDWRRSFNGYHVYWFKNEFQAMMFKLTFSEWSPKDVE